MTVTAIDGYRAWAATYDAAPNPILALERRMLPKLLGEVHGLRALDLACGTGQWAAHLARGGARTWGVDLCAAMLTHAPVGLRGRLIVGTAEKLPFAAARFDLVVCSFALGYFPDLGVVLGEVARIGAHGAKVLLSDVHPEAIARGWSRSFRAGAVRYEIEHTPHSLHAIRRSAESAGLALEEEEHLNLGTPERTLFELAGKSDAFAACTEVPAVWIAKWAKR